MRFYEIMQIVPVLSLIIAVIGTIFIYALVLPESRRNSLNGFFRAVADFLNFKSLILEKILKFIYVLATVTVVAMGALLFLFALFSDYAEQSLTGLLILILGPIALRITYEILMMGILLVKNVIEINKKLGASGKTVEPIKADAPKKAEDSEPVFVNAANPAPETNAPVAEPIKKNVRVCSVCGKEASKNAVTFCEFCGNKLEN